VQVLATFTIFLREGIEASMIVAILLAYLDKIGKRENFRDVIIGVVAALAFAVLAGVAVYATLKTYAGTRLQTEFETVTYLIAAAVMTYMTFWMSARNLAKELREKAEFALKRGARLGLAVMAAQAVGRESLEAMVFTLAIVFATSTKGAAVGAVVGTLASLAFAVAVYRLGKRINMARAFRVMGVALMIFAAGLLIDAVENLQQLGFLPVLTTAMWDTTSFLNDQSPLGDIVHTFFGYASRPSILQGLVYVAYLAIVVTIFMKTTRRRVSHANRAVNAEDQPSAKAG
jgi:high-affinity iron transporter